MTQRITVDIDPNEIAKNLGGQLDGVRLIDLDTGRPVAGFVLSPKVAVQLIFKEPVELDDPFA